MGTLLGKRVIEQWGIDFVHGSSMTDSKAKAKLRRRGCRVFRCDDHYDIEREQRVRRVTGYVVR